MMRRIAMAIVLLASSGCGTATITRHYVAGETRPRVTVKRVWHRDRLREAVRSYYWR